MKRTPVRVLPRTSPDCPLTAEISFVDGEEWRTLRLSGVELFNTYDELHKVVQRYLDREAADVHISYMPVSGDG